MMIAIIDYGMGNLRSVQKAFEKVGAPAMITQNKNDIDKAEKVVLPGVGAIKPAMEKLLALDLVDPIKQAVSNNKPFLGICLGFQLLFDKSDEGGDVKGLSLLKGLVEKFQSLKIPQIGWNQINIKKKDCALFDNVTNAAHMYFCHSYYVKPEEDIVAATTDYGLEFASCVWKNNIYGVQFHPEKSQNVGLKILENFAELHT